MRWLPIAGFALLLSGCGLPPVVTAVTFAFDLLSYSQTGKGIADHGLSQVVQRDCAFLRLFQGRLCGAPLDGDGVLVALAPLPDPAVTPWARHRRHLVLRADGTKLDSAAVSGNGGRSLDSNSSAALTIRWNTA